MTGPALAHAAIALAILMLAAWPVSLALGRTAIADVVWGAGAFALVAWSVRLTVDGADGSAGTLLLVLVSVWGLRLSAYLAARIARDGEDARYAAMRRRHARTWWVRSLVAVFAFQGAIAWVVGLPLWPAVGGESGAVGALGVAGALVWLAGVGMEATADRQLRAFKADPANEGLVMDRGVWRYSRHPNYFGDATAWWGFYLVALDAGAPVWTAVGPALMTYILAAMPSAGVSLLEKSLRRRRPGYEDYVRRTSAFVPRPPRA